MTYNRLSRIIYTFSLTSPTEPQIQQAQWEMEYKSFVSRVGQSLCEMSYAGYKEFGRGAIYANYDNKPSKEVCICMVVIFM